MDERYVEQGGELDIDSKTGGRKHAIYNFWYHLWKWSYWIFANCFIFKDINSILYEKRDQFIISIIHLLFFDETALFIALYPRIKSLSLSLSLYSSKEGRTMDQVYDGIKIPRHNIARYYNRTSNNKIKRLNLERYSRVVD